MKKSILASSILALLVASAANAGQTFDTAAGSLYLGGDVEFDYTSQTNDNVTSGGRLLIDIHGQKVLDNGAFASFAVAPTFGQTGGTGTDDVKFAFGMQNDWSLTVGRFEAQDLSPAGQDTYVASSGTTMYRAATARGRVSGSGDAQATFNKTMSAAGFELTAQSQDNGDLVILRPAVTADLSNKVSMIVGLEVPVAGNEVAGVSDSADWLGAGGALILQATDALTLTARAAFLADDTDQTTSVDSYTAGLNAQYNNFFISALYGESDSDSDANDTTETQVYASYKIPAVMEINNFDIYLGAGWSEAELNKVTQDEVVGARVRFKYIF
ncbi:raffinose porin [Psychromonas ingrahamii 37]|uniref:Raffinose porin n=1 Tax=Psychromonas ingrahamii (strain DSM 17664 / CCUG 51855 / 37) TaxID=357804 RepID=A1T0X2_PSYIN|nr:carbohydrate porin [Psychromonas ingrahamii]ABM05387.1 raffinose porin [Psychromonas ingrahamii 37]